MMVGVTDEVWGHRMEGHRRMREESGFEKRMEQVGIGLGIARRRHRRKKRRRQGRERSSYLPESEASGRER
jgi:hypothetical protein